VLGIGLAPSGGQFHTGGPRGQTNRKTPSERLHMPIVALRRNERGWHATLQHILGVPFGVTVVRQLAKATVTLTRLFDRGRGSDVWWPCGTAARATIICCPSGRCQCH